MNELIEGIIQIANNKKVTEKLEPNLMWHQDVKEWMIKRVLYSYLLLEEERREK